MVRPIRQAPLDRTRGKQGRQAHHGKVFGVAEYIELLNILFKSQEARILGEISQCKVHAPSGHVYFTMKDKSGNGILDCIIWKGIYALCGITLEPGLEVIVSGHPNLYAATGRFSIIASAVEPVGEGALKKAYDALKKKLEAEGLFEEARKKIVPEFVRTIGVITSREGAVIHDFLNNLGKYGFRISLIDSRVEGQQAAQDLLSAIQTFRTEEIDVLVIIRGGGSLESLQAFNNEMLVREIIDFPVPVIVGVGHDKDVSLLALAADRMVSTPTAVANLINISWEQAYRRLAELRYFLLNRVPVEIRRVGSEIEDMRDAIRTSFEDVQKTAGEKIASAIELIRVNDPRRQLRLGYAVVQREGKTIRDVDRLTTGDLVAIQLYKGSFESEVKKIKQ